VGGAARLYWEVAKRGFSRYSTYRAATVAGVITNSVFGFIRAYILIALFRQRAHIGGFDVRDALTYTFVSQGFLMPMAMFGWYEIEQRVRTGDIVSDLYRPVDFQGYWLALDGGRALYQAIGRGIPPVLVGAVFFSLRTPPAAAWPVFAVSCVLGLTVSFGLRFLVNLLSFWIIDIRGPAQILVMLELFFGGVVLPIALFPRGLEVLARALPFASIAQLPVEVYLGKHPGADALSTLAVQAAWAAALLFAGRALLGAVMRKLVVQGG
jgi:ABC-2 type transport system permease protein